MTNRNELFMLVESCYADRGEEIKELITGIWELLAGGNKNALEMFQNAAAGILATGDPAFCRNWLEATSEIPGLPWEIIWTWLGYSPALQGILAGEDFPVWARFCISLGRYDPRMCIQMIKNSPSILGGIDEEGRSFLLKSCNELFHENWRASFQLFNNLPVIFGFLKKEEITEWYREGLALSRRNDARVGEAYFKAGTMWSGASFELFKDWTRRGGKIAESSAAAGAAYFNTVPVLLGALGRQACKEILPEWGGWIEKILRMDPEVAACFIDAGGAVIPQIGHTGLGPWAESLFSLSRMDKKAALALAQTSNRIFEELNIDEYVSWFRHVLSETSPDGERLREALALRTRESKKGLLSFRRGVTLEDVAKTLAYFALALFDREVIIKSSRVLPKTLTGPGALFATGDGKRVYLPEFIGVFPANEDNLQLYKALLVHEIARLEEGTYTVNGADLAVLAREFGLTSGNTDVPDLHRYFLRFENYALIRDLFEIIEDARVEAAFWQKHPGLARELNKSGYSGEESELKELPAGLPPVLDRLSPGWKESAAHWHKYFKESFQNTIKSGSPVKDSLRLATDWYFLLKSKTDLWRPYKSYHSTPRRGKICPVLPAVAGEVEREAAVPGRLAGGLPGGATSLTGDGKERDEVIDYLTNLLAGFKREEENVYKAVADYDEWDTTFSGYKPGWVRVREIALRSSTAFFVQATLENHHGLVASLKRYFALLRPDRFRRFRRQEEGDQEDLDAMVEARVERKMGITAPGGLYIRRDKRVRDVAVAFLIDLSASTGQKLAGGKTVLDVEKESVVIMAEALEALGDQYAIYGFNSEGRERVNFHIVKEFYEDYSLEVKQRYGGLKSAGQTRLGAAVRHAARKLEKVEASVRLLFLLSDGRPYDTDYCTELDATEFSAWLKHDELLYAREDSRMAVLEAKMKRMTPFCLTVDHKGKEYLEKIMGPAGYVVIDDIALLPVKLPEIYKKLTV